MNPGKLAIENIVEMVTELNKAWDALKLENRNEGYTIPKTIHYEIEAGVVADQTIGGEVGGTIPIVNITLGFDYSRTDKSNTSIKISADFERIS